MKETKFTIRAIPETISRSARATLKSPQYGHPAHAELAGGTGPCRQCLRTFEVGQERRILFTYNPFDGVDPYPSPGPIFVHETPCATYSAANEFPDTLRALPLMLEGYGRNRWIAAREKIDDGAAEAAIAKIFQDPAVEYIHVRHGEAGCFIAHVARSPQATPTI
ncbi:MAG: DUF1203 domain-containing protein [Candidatus Acidiferrales bacterium]